MSDKREAIMVRLEEILTAIAEENGGTFGRNEKNVDEHQAKTITMFDSDEQNDNSAAGKGRPSHGPQIVDMSPEIFINLGSADEQVGTKINAIRARIIKDILTDTELKALTLHGDMIYEGMMTGLSVGRGMEAEAGMSFSFSYLLRPAEL